MTNQDARARAQARIRAIASDACTCLDHGAASVARMRAVLAAPLESVHELAIAGLTEAMSELEATDYEDIAIECRRIGV
jgi:hypothetical protein